MKNTFLLFLLGLFPGAATVVESAGTCTSASCSSTKGNVLLQNGVRQERLTSSAEEMVSALQAEANVVAEIVAGSRFERKVSVNRSQTRQQYTATEHRRDEAKGKSKSRTMVDKLLFGIPRQSTLFMMNLDGSDLEAFVKSGSRCPHLEGTAMADEATAMMGRPAEYIAVDEINDMAFWADWLGGSGSGNATFNASIFSSPLESPVIDPTVTSAYYRPPPGHPEGVEGCNAYSDYACPPAVFHQPTGDLPITHLDSPIGFSVDPVEKMLYWSDTAPTQGELGVGPTEPVVQRASYDGHTIPPETFTIAGMIGETIATAIDYRPEQRKFYWIDYVNMKKDAENKTLIGSEIKRANLDGTGMEVLATFLTRFPRSLALDLMYDQFYWTEEVGGRISRCPLSGCPVGAYNIGSEPEIVLETLPDGYHSHSMNLGQIAVDPGLGMMYWTEDHMSDDTFYGGRVMSAKTDGSDATELYRYMPPILPSGKPNSEMKAAPLGIAIVIKTSRSMTTATTSAPPTTTKTDEKDAYDYEFPDYYGDYYYDRPHWWSGWWPR